jgi:hypothetical protein
MDHADPKTRKEQKGGKYKSAFNAKTVRLKEALQEKNKDKKGDTKKAKK